MIMFDSLFNVFTISCFLIRNSFMKFEFWLRSFICLTPCLSECADISEKTVIRNMMVLRYRNSSKISLSLKFQTPKIIAENNF